jgi:hypothetical protein
MKTDFRDQAEYALWLTGPRYLSPSEITAAVWEIFAARVDQAAAVEALRNDPRFLCEGSAFRLNVPDSQWTRFRFSVN